jgi:hypothetical protein
VFTKSTAILGIPYPEQGSIPTSADCGDVAQVIENYLRAALRAAGGSRVFVEGSYAYTVNANTSVDVTLSGTPALLGMIDEQLVEVTGTIAWRGLTAGSTYHLGVQANNDLFRNRASVTAVTSPTPPTSAQVLYLATLNNITAGTPVLNSSPAGKYTLANLATLLATSTDPFGVGLSQQNVTVTSVLNVILGAIQTCFVQQANAGATRAALTVQQAAGGQPHLKGTDELRLADSRTPIAGYPLTDASYAGLPFGATSLLGAINRSWRTLPVNLTDAATIATDAALGNLFAVTLGGNRTLGAPTNGLDGQRLSWRLRQDATGSRTLALAAGFRSGSTFGTPVLSTTANAVDYLAAMYVVADNKWDVTGFVKGT